MYSYIIGKITRITKKYLVLENNNIGYIIYMSEKSLLTYDVNMENVCIYTYQNVREDEISLFGFKTLEEKNLFEQLITVSGIGAKTAITMISALDVSEFVIAIISSDIAKLTKMPGVGKKTAQRIIIELQDKLKAPYDMEDVLEQSKKLDENSEKYR